MNLSRRKFIGRGRAESEVPLPWLVSPASFFDECTRCGECIDRCPQQIVIKGDGGFPTIDFSQGECTFCGDCTQACEANLFHSVLEPEQIGWTHRARVEQHCLAQLGVMCRCCEDACEPRAIRFPLALGQVPRPEVDTDSCNGCGACVAPCPENAIVMAPPL